MTDFIDPLAGVDSSNIDQLLGDTQAQVVPLNDTLTPLGATPVARMAVTPLGARNPMRPAPPAPVRLVPPSPQGPVPGTRPGGTLVDPRQAANTPASTSWMQDVGEGVADHAPLGGQPAARGVQLGASLVAGSEPAQTRAPASPTSATPARALAPSAAPAPEQPFVDPMTLANPFALLAPPPAPRAADDDWDITRGFKTAMHQLPELAGASVAYAGHVLKELGADNVGQAMLDYGLGVYKEHKKDTDALSEKADSFSYAMKHPSELGDWMAYGLGYAGGQAIMSLASMAIGALAGSEVPVAGNVVGAAAGLVARKTVERAVIKQAEKLIAEKLAKGVAEGTAKKLARAQAEKQVEKQLAEKLGADVAKQAVQGAVGRRVGATAGKALAAGGLNVSQELGSIYGDAREQAQAEGRELDGTDLARIGVMSVAAAGVDTLAELVNLSRFTNGVKLGNEGSQLKRRLVAGLKEVGKGAGRESGTEAAQTVLERVGAGQPVANAEGVQDIVDSAALGALGGAAAGAGAGLHVASQPPAAGTQAPAEPPPENRGTQAYAQQWQRAREELAQRQGDANDPINAEDENAAASAVRDLASRHGVSLDDLISPDQPEVTEAPAGSMQDAANTMAAASVEPQAAAPAIPVPHPDAAAGSLSDAANAIVKQAAPAPESSETQNTPATSPEMERMEQLRPVENDGYEPPMPPWMDQTTGEVTAPDDKQLTDFMAATLADKFQRTGNMRISNDRLTQAWGLDKIPGKVRKKAMAMASQHLQQQAENRRADEAMAQVDASNANADAAEAARTQAARTQAAAAPEPVEPIEQPAATPAAATDVPPVAAPAESGPAQPVIKPLGEKGLLVEGDPEAIRAQLAAAGFKKKGRVRKDGLRLDAADAEAVRAALGATAPATTAVATPTAAPAAEVTPPAVSPVEQVPVAVGDKVTVRTGKHAGKAGTVFRAGQNSVGVQFESGEKRALSPKALARQVPETAATGPEPLTLQNRQRGRAASLVQMSGIAKNPDPSRLAFSRDPNTGAPMVSSQAPDSLPATDLGKQDVVHMPGSNRSIPVRYAVVDADQVQASHHADGTVNHDYAGAALRALNNGRVAGLKAAWKNGNAGQYKQGLVDDAVMMGLNPEAIASKKQPVVIRLYDAKHDVGDMGAESNAQANLGLSPVEQATTDARALPDLHDLPITETGELSTNPANPFYRKFLQALGTNEAAKLVDGEGRPNKTFFDRLQAAIFAKAYGSDRLISAMAEDADPNARNVLRALVNAAPAWARIDKDAVLGDYAARVVVAFDVLRQARESGQTVDAFLLQGDLAGRDERGDAWARMFATNARSFKRMTAALREAARIVDDAQQHAASGDMFGAGSPDPDEVTERVIAFMEREYGQARPEGDRSASGESHAAPGPVPDRGGREGRESGENERAQAESAGNQEPVTPQSAAPAGDDMFGAPTAQERLRAAQEAKDASRNGLDKAGRKDIHAGDGELFEGPRPEQADLAAPAPKPTEAPESTPLDSRKRLDQTENLDDFGEKLGGARKDQPRSLATELSDADIASQPLSKIWPASDIDQISDPFARAFAFAARAEIPSKPRASYKVKRWAEKVKVLRELALAAVNGKLTAENILDQMRGMENFASKVKLLQALDQSQWPRVGEVHQWPDSIKYNRDGTQTPWSHVVVQVDGKVHDLAGPKSLNDPRVLPWVKGLLATDKPESRMKFEIRRDRKTGEHFINKVGDGEYRRLKTFDSVADSVADARQFLKENHAELVSAWEAVKASDNVGKGDTRRKTNRARKGPDYRAGKDVTDDMFSDTFGFRGVEFGNWVKQGKGDRDRQGMLNQAYDALMDLAAIVGVPPRAMSLNGSLGLALGSRGSGRASAHFEPDRLVINLTKTKGAGSLAHEWFHALDNYFARMRGEPEFSGDQEAYRKKAYVTYRPEPMLVHKSTPGARVSFALTEAELQRRHEKNPQNTLYDPANWMRDPKHPEGVRPVVEKAFADLVATLNASGMKDRSMTITKGKPEGYWSQIIERAARSFENYAIVKMADQGIENDFLANVVTPAEFARANDRYPYLLPDEVGPVAQAFDALFNTIETRQDDQGNVAMFSRAPRVQEVDLTGPANHNTVYGNASALQRDSDAAATDGHVRSTGSVQGQLDLFTSNAAGQSRADQQEAGRFFQHVKNVQVGSFRSGIKKIRDWRDAAHIIAPLRKNPQEQFLAVVADQHGKPLAVLRHSMGIRNASAVDPGIVFGAIAQIPGAKQVWFAHNHPSGHMRQSPSDLQITSQLHDLMRGSGIEAHGMIQVGPGHKTATYSNPDTGHYGNEPAGNITPAARTDTVPVVERAIRKALPAGSTLRVGSLDQMRAAYARYGNRQTGLLIVNNQSEVVGFLPLTDAEMSRLRTSDPDTGAAHVMRSITKAGGAGAFVFAKNTRSGMNVATLLKQANIRPFDVLTVRNGQVIDSRTENAQSLTTGSFFSRSGGGVSGRKANLNAIIEETRRAWSAAPNIVAVDGFHALPAKVQRDALDQGSNGTDIAAAWHGGTVYLVGNHPKLATRAGVEQAIFHEVWGHHGLRLVLGKNTNRVLATMAEAMGGIPGMLRYAKKYHIDLSEYVKGVRNNPAYSRELRQAILLDELAAHIAQNGTPTMRQRLREYLGAIKAWLRAHGFMELARASDLDLAYLLKQSRDAVVKGKPLLPGSRATTFFQRVYHGTHARDVGGEGFKLAHIGSGEGAQAYGYGIYFAGNQDVANGYRERLTRMRGVDAWLAAEDAAKAAGSTLSAAIAERIKRWVDAGNDAHTYYDAHAEKLSQFSNKAEYSAAADAYEAVRKGHLYSANIPEDHELLDWDKPLSEQPEGVRKALTDAGIAPSHPVSEAIRNRAQRILRDARRESEPGAAVEDVINNDGSLYQRSIDLADSQNISLDQLDSLGGAGDYVARTARARVGDIDRKTGRDIYNELVSEKRSPEAASKYLNSIGIPGLRYLDAGSRGQHKPGGWKVAFHSGALSHAVHDSREEAQAAVDAHKYNNVAKIVQVDGPTHNYVIWDESRLTPEAAGIQAMFARSGRTRDAYDARIDALFKGARPARQGVQVLNRSDVLDLLGHGTKPVRAVESKIVASATSHGLSMQDWKRLPEWLENPAAVFESDTVKGRLVAVAPELVDGKPVFMVLEPNSQTGGLDAHVLVNAYDKDKPGVVPVQRWTHEGKLLYLDQKRSPEVAARSGLQLPRDVRQLRGYKRRVLTEANLDKYRVEYADSGQRLLDMVEPGTALRNLAMVNRVADQVRARWGDHAPPVTVVTTADQLPAHIKREPGWERAKGVYSRGRVWLVSAHLRNTKDVLKTMVHEAVGHHGVEHVVTSELGPDAWNKIIRSTESMRARVQAMQDANRKAGKPANDGLTRVQQAVADVIRRYGADTHPTTFAHETLAVLSERGIRNVWMDRVIQALRRLVRRLAPELKLSDAELQQLLVAGERYLKTGETYDARVARVQASLFSLASPIRSEAFKRWFGDWTNKTADASKVVDATGAPLVVYHGTGEEFTVFSDRQLGTATGHATSPLGFFATPNRAQAERYAENASQGVPAEQEVMDLYMDIRKPYTMSLAQAQAIETKDQARALRAKLEKQGYDGIHMPDTQSWIAFKSTQIKSASRNTGAFDPANPDIRFSRDGWSPRFPDVMTAHKPGFVREQPEYEAAKAGERTAALKLARAAVTPKFVQQVKDALGDDLADVVVVPVRASERAGHNMIPSAAAKVLADRLGAEVETGILQADKVNRGGSDAIRRLAAQPQFTGPVTPGARYVLIDDTLTQGGTLAQLKTHIERQGGEVVLVTALTGKDYSRTLGLKPETLGKVRERFGSIEPWWREHFGYGFDGLTQSEARTLLTYDKGRLSPDGLRDRLLAEGVSGSRSLDGRATGDRPGAETPRVSESNETPPTGGVSGSGATRFSRSNATLDALDKVLAEGDQTAWQKVKAKVAGKWQDMQPVMLGALQLRHIMELAEGHKALHGASRFADLNQRMEANRNTLLSGAHDAAERPDDMLAQGAAPLTAAMQKWAHEKGWQGMRGRLTKEAKRTFKLMHDATIFGLDPSGQYKRLQVRDGRGKFVDWTPELVRERIKVLQQQQLGRSGDDKKPMQDEIKHLRAFKKREKEREAHWPDMVKRWQSLSSEAQTIYKNTRDWYAQHRDATEEALIERIMLMDIPQGSKRSLADKLRMQFESNRVEGVYFPLDRNGEYWVSLADAQGREAFLMFEEAQEFKRAVHNLRNRGFTIKSMGRRDDNARAKDAPSGTFVNDVIMRLKKDGVNEEIQDDIYQMFLKSMPEMSMRTRSIHRRSVPGYNPNALRAFAKNSFHGSYQLARLRYSQQMQMMLEAMQQNLNKFREEAEPGKGTKADPKEVLKAEHLLAEIKKRYQWIMQPTDSQLASRLTSIGFLYYLGLSPASALVNLTQGAQVTFPVLGGRHGWNRAGKVLSATTAAALRTGGNIERTLTNPDEKRAYAKWVERGDIDRTNAHTLAGVAEGDMLAMNPAWQRVMRGMSWMFHKAEIVNREAAAVAAYRLARQDGMEHDEAVKYASDVVNMTQFDYANSNRPRWMQQGWQKVLFQFKNYSLGMTWMLWRNLYQAFKGESPEVKKAARRTLTGILGMTALLSGVMGLPIINGIALVANAAHAVGGDPDDPWDFMTEFRKWLDDMFGDGVGSLIADGAVDKLGLHLSSRVSLSNLWFRDVDRNLEGADAYRHFLETMAGPLGGLAKNVLFVGPQRISEGHVWRGVETMLPTFAKNGMKSLRYAAEGVNTLRGDPIIQDSSATEDFLQALGFQPTRVAEQWRENNALLNAQHFVRDRRRALMNAYAMSISQRDGEARQEAMIRIRQFNRKWPQWPISASTLKRSLRSRAQYSAKAEHGVKLNARLESRLRDITGVEKD